MTPVDAAKRFAEAADVPTVSDDHLQSLAREFFESLNGTPAEQAADAMGIVAGAIGLPDPRRATLAAMVCGSMVEHGADPAPMAGPLLDRVSAAARGAREFYDACAARVPADAEDDRDELMEIARKHLAQSMPKEAAAWELLDSLFPAALAVLCASPAARRNREQLLADARAIEGDDPSAYWLVKLLQVLHDEPYVAIEPSSQTGIAGRMCGIADNFQLNMLLMDVFPRGLFERRRISPSAAAVARGLGPQKTGDVVAGTWNLYTAAALRPDGRLPDAKDLETQATWIWNEGVPADIPVFDGHRVILLGPASYHRGWGLSRLFDRLKADLTVERRLSKAEVKDWLKRLAAAPRVPTGTAASPG
jgi:hypothetical protein